MTRGFMAGATQFLVRCSSSDIADATEAVFSDLPSASPNEDSVEIQIDGQGHELSVNFVGNPLGLDGPFGPPANIDGAMTNVVSAVSRLALDSDTTRFHLHCAALSRKGRGVIVSAASGTGKTVLSATLAARGWSYMSDEAVALQTGSSSAFGFPKPMVLKPGGHTLVPGLRPAHRSLGSPAEPWCVPASSIPARTTHDIDPKLIVVLLRHQDGTTEAAPTPVEMHPTETAVALLTQSLDPERFGLGALALVARLAARCHCIMIPVGPPALMSQVIEDLIDETPKTFPVIELDSTAVKDPAWRVPERVASVIIGERAVVQNNVADGVIAPLDEAATAIWLALHGQAPSWLPAGALTEPGSTAFLDQLAAHGLLAPASEASF